MGSQLVLVHLDNRQGEAPPSSKPQPNGDVKLVEQLKSAPGGDKPSSAAKVEGLLDGSEDPTKT